MVKINTVGIVAEYNPFHNGHLYQLNEAKRKSGAKNVVAVMSGSIVQRGDFAVFDKWTRAELAVKNGVNLCLELPCVYSGQTAEVFAKGAIRLMHSLGVVDGISFGAEAADVDSIVKTAKLLINETEEYKEKLSKYLREGLGFPAARSRALYEAYGIDFADTPNNILAVEYAKAIIENNYDFKMFPVLRKGSMHDKEGSASYIRELLEKNMDYSSFVPSVADAKPVFLKDFSDIILYKLRTVTAGQLAYTADTGEGIENRIISFAKQCTTIDELIKSIGTKRYSNARIRRIIINALLGITKEDINKPPSYIRVLGADEKGRELLREIKIRSELPVITKLADAPDIPMLEKEIAATSVYSLALKVPGNLEYKKSPFIL